MNRFPWREQWDEERDQLERELTDIDTGPETATQQQFKDDVNINVMMKRMGITDGNLPPAATDPRYFGDFTDVGDFRDNLDRVRDATQRFNALPAALRSRFNNDPATLFNFVMDSANAEESVKLGLLAKLEESPDLRGSETPTP